MYLWNRLLMASPAKFTEAAPLLMDAVAYVNSASDHTYNLWGTVLGQTGGFGVSALCADFGALSDEMAARGIGDETFRDKVSAVGACMDGSPEDTLWEIVHSIGDWPDAPAVLGNAIMGFLAVVVEAGGFSGFFFSAEASAEIRTSILPKLLPSRRP